MCLKTIKNRYFPHPQYVARNHGIETKNEKIVFTVHSIKIMKNWKIKYNITGVCREEDICACTSISAKALIYHTSQAKKRLCDTPCCTSLSI